MDEARGGSLGGLRAPRGDSEGREPGEDGLELALDPWIGAAGFGHRW